MSERPVFTPREIVSELDRHIVGQDRAKRAVAIALRNRWRRQRVPDELRDEIAPKNIIMIGPTGVGKTEIARRLAKLGQAPFLKIEATKFTEIGYVGRDVESMIRDLTELGVSMVKAEQMEKVSVRARAKAQERVAVMLAEQKPGAQSGALKQQVFTVSPEGEATTDQRTDRLLFLLRQGELDNEEITVEITATPGGSTMEVFTASGLEEMVFNLKDMFGNLAQGAGGKKRTKTMRVEDAVELLAAEESVRMIDMESVIAQALERVQEAGIIFLDEIDKIAGGRGQDGSRGPDVSRGGVQRDLLPIVEGTSVSTKHGIVKTDHILFIAAGAFHATKVSDLIPELQGRFPIRVELDPLGEEEFLRILQEPSASLVRQYQALMATEGLSLTFTDEALRRIARVAFEVNTRLENIGARRLHTVMENLLEEVSFRAPELVEKKVEITAAEVTDRLGKLLADEDLSRYIL